MEPTPDTATSPELKALRSMYAQPEDLSVTSGISTSAVHSTSGENKYGGQGQGDLSSSHHGDSSKYEGMCK